MADTGIYEIRNTINGKRYVGSAVLFKKRWKEHVRQLSDSRHHSVVLQRAWDRYGSEAFEFKPIIYCDRANLIMYEQIAMDALLPDYNVAPRAGSQLGFKMREEAKAKMSEAAKRTRNFTGKTHSEESRAKISASRMGKGGGPRTPERLERIAIAMRAAKSVLNAEKVRTIRLMNAKGVRHRDVADAVGCSYWAVADVVRGRCFSWVK